MSTVALLGFAVGIVLALTGAGGGILAVPLLVFGAGLSVAQAGPVGLLAVALAASLGAVMGLRSGTVRYKAALLVATAGVVCSPLGLWLAQRMPNRPLTAVFAVVLMYVAARAWQRSRCTGAALPQRSKPPPCRLDLARGKLNWTAPCARALCWSGLVAGGLSGLLGVGGGFVMVPALQRFTDLGTQSVLATSLAVIALVSLAGVAASAATGHLEWAIALPFALGALAGMGAGRLLAARLPGARLQQGFALVSALVAVAMLMRALG
ncbi:sulfite exporter TauE/SafE family protein [Massilia antarctica]|uniref:sulfite exporter TauE/SafE family protein n=1 Tax=Massilia antarctica TaxID=2765360 RepID=UPI0006BB61E8|nr:sulfite exporter TauE/SafE family protein [Massilia sp. H27-R4]MCY0914345.1 sulfite exporter TauE/SafE family protein [Massilia sp. H27-R4]CUI03283.1 membrane protein, putative [Janthinobacterium sp. CG23_2]CUU27069.1 membrane protein, putative [Janthinobacterium sp. CG23_2]